MLSPPFLAESKTFVYISILVLYHKLYPTQAYLQKNEGVFPKNYKNMSEFGCVFYKNMSEFFRKITKK